MPAINAPDAARTLPTPLDDQGGHSDAERSSGPLRSSGERFDPRHCPHCGKALGVITTRRIAGLRKRYIGCRKQRGGCGYA
jgi:hypothetical protein